jgi:hypothetical protein
MQFTKINPTHLLIRLLLFGGLSYIILRYLAIILIWLFITGDAGPAKGTEIYVDALYYLSAIIVLLPFILYRIWINRKKGNKAKVNDYLIVGLEVILMSAIFVYNLYT